MENKINVFSEIGELKKVVVHTPGDELKYVSPNRLEELLFSNVIEFKEAKREHLDFVSKLRDEGVEVIELIDLVEQTIQKNNNEIKEKFIKDFLEESSPKLQKFEKDILFEYFNSFDNIKKMVALMMSGITQKDLKIDNDRYLIIDPLPNLYFARDNFISVGNSIIISNMKYKTRKRETIFTNFIFKNHPEYKNANIIFERKNLNDEESIIEGGDVFIYSKEALVVGVSERTNMKAIFELGKNLKKNKNNEFKVIYAINVPKMKSLMHLDTWLTMIDFNKFIYSPNILSDIKCWKIDLSNEILKEEEINGSIKDIVKEIIKQEPILIPVGGENASQIRIDVETNFDATNYLVIRPGVVIGYDRNFRTQEALEKAGIKVISFEGNQLSLGMGSSRCMSMPLYRENLK